MEFIIKLCIAEDSACVSFMAMRFPHSPLSRTSRGPKGQSVAMTGVPQARASRME